MTKTIGKSLCLAAPCKINLSLDICGRLPNGYHRMDMVMQTVDLCDRVRLTIGEPGLRMSGSDPALACDESNLCLRCAKAFYDDTKIPPQADIYLEKHIPMQAGLGGGSADGAAVLCGLNRLHHAGLSMEELCRIGFALGADIPFCIRGGTCRVQGAGEILLPAPKLSEKLTVLLVKPRFSVSTKLAFQGFDQQKSPAHADVEAMLLALEQGDPVLIGEKLENVFEPYCQGEQRSAIGEIKDKMRSCGAVGALMSGSGSAVFGLFLRPEEAGRCGELLSPDMEQVALAKPLSRGIFALCEEMAE